MQAKKQAGSINLRNMKSDLWFYDLYGLQQNKFEVLPAWYDIGLILLGINFHSLSFTQISDKAVLYLSSITLANSHLVSFQVYDEAPLPLHCLPMSV